MPEFGYKWLETMDSTGVMPPFQGDAEDRAALVAYLLSLRGERVDPADVVERPPPPPPRRPRSVEVRP